MGSFDRSMWDGKKKSDERVLMEEDKDVEKVLATSQHLELEAAEEVRKETMIKEILEDGATQKIQGNITGKEKGDSEGSGWSLVSPTKAGKTPEKLANGNQNENFPISASKFAVLCIEEEEDGEIRELCGLVADTVDTNVEQRGDDAEGAGAAGPNLATAAESEGTSNHDSDVSKENRGKGVKREPSINKEKEKKAKSHDASTAKGTRSSRRLQ